MTNTAEQIEYYKTEHRHMKVADTPFVNLIVDEFLKRGRIKKNEKLLELGAGYGRFSIPLLKKGYRAELSDVVPEMLDGLRKNFESRKLKTKIVSLDINKNPPKEKYDVICGFHVLHHLGNLKAAFLHMNKGLKNKGRIAFVEPNGINPLFYLQMIVMPEVKWKYEKGMLRMINPTLKKALEEADFKDIEITHFGFFPDFIVNRGFGAKLERMFNQTKKNPMALYKMIVAHKKQGNI